MNLSDLKDKINNKEVIQLPLIFKYADTDYLVKTYINAIASNNELVVKEVNDVNEIIDIESGMFKDAEYLYVYYTDKSDGLGKEELLKYNLIIVTTADLKDIDIEKAEFGKLENWQVEAYIGKLVPGLKENEIKWICKNAKFDIDRLDNEACKLNIFDEKDQRKIFEEINDDNGYADLNELTIFNLSNAIVKKDIVEIKHVVEDIDNIDVEGTGLVTILLKNFLNIIHIQTDRNASAAGLGISEKQFRYLQYNQCNKYSNKQLFDIYSFLTGVDYKLKSGLLEMTNQQLVYYVLSNILN